MLRLTKVFEVRDAYSDLASLPSTASSSRQNDDPHGIGDACIIGREKCGVLLMTRNGIDDDKIAKTFIDMYDLQTKQRTTIYRHEMVTKCVSASINAEKTLLAFTTLSRYRANQQEGQPGNADFEEIYESCLVEVQPQEKCYSLNIRSREHQRIQFLPSPSNSQGGRSGMNYTSFLFFLDQEFVHLYLITSQKRKEGSGLRITAQPHLMAVVQKLYHWYSWDILRSLLYVLLPSRPTPQDRRRSGNHKSPVPGSENVTLFRCLNFQDSKRGDILFEVPLAVRVPPRIFSPIPWPTVMNPDICVPGSPARDQAGRFDVVHLRGNAVVLCQQNLIFQTQMGSTPSIHITLFLLHQKGKISFSVPLHNLSPESTRFIHAVFGSWGDMLVVYIAGHHLQFIDCGCLHEARDSLVFSGAEYATLLPQQDPQADSVPLAVSFDLNSVSIESDPNTTSDMRGHMVLDCHRGIVYEFYVDRGVLMDLLLTSDAAAQHVQALHLAIIHMRDQEFVDQLMVHLCTRFSQHVTPFLMKEFLLGTTYQACLDKVRDEASLVMDLLPFSTIPALHEPSRRRMVQRITYQTLSNEYEVQGMTRTFLSRRFYVDQVAPKSPTPPSKAPTPNTPQSPKPQRGWLLRLFTGDGKAPDRSPSLQSVDKDHEEGPATPGRLSRDELISSLASHLISPIKGQQNAEESQRNMNWATRVSQDYVELQVLQCSRLFNFILSAMPSDADGHAKEKLEQSYYTVFMLLQNFYCALEELSFPFPQGFHAQFAKLAFTCLPWSVFFQYVQRGIVVVTEPFLREIASLPDCDQTKIEALTLYLPSRRATLAALQLPEKKIPAQLLIDATRHAEEAPPHAPTHSVSHCLAVMETALGNASYGPDVFAPPKEGPELDVMPVPPHQGELPAQDKDLPDPSTWAKPPDFIPLTLFLNSLNLASSESDFAATSLAPEEVHFVNEHARCINQRTVTRSPEQGLWKSKQAAHVAADLNMEAMSKLNDTE